MTGGPVAVAVVGSRMEAELIAGLLRSNGIGAAVSADDAGGQEPQLQLDGVRVLVAAADEAAARELLADVEAGETRDDLDAVGAAAGAAATAAVAGRGRRGPRERAATSPPAERLVAVLVAAARAARRELDRPVGLLGAGTPADRLLHVLRRAR